MKQLFVPFVLLIVLGCSGDTREYMPLGEGREWVYIVRTDGDETTQTIKTVRRAPVGVVDGWLLESEMGAMRLAWDGDTLLAAELPDTQFAPPIPLLSSKESEWKGMVSTPTGRIAGTAKLTRSKEQLDVGGNQFDTIKTLLTLNAGGETVQLTTWFYPGMGILRQEQHRGPNMTRDRFIEFVEGG